MSWTISNVLITFTFYTKLLYDLNSKLSVNIIDPAIITPEWL